MNNIKIPNLVTLSTTFWPWNSVHTKGLRPLSSLIGSASNMSLSKFCIKSPSEFYQYMRTDPNSKDWSLHQNENQSQSFNQIRFYIQESLHKSR